MVMVMAMARKMLYSIMVARGCAIEATMGLHNKVIVRCVERIIKDEGQVNRWQYMTRLLKHEQT